MELYKRTGSNPLSSCLPLLIQMPIFSALFFAVNDAQHGKEGVGFLRGEYADSLEAANLWGAPLKETFFGAIGKLQSGDVTDGVNHVSVLVIAAVMIITMTVSQFITQKQILAKNQNPDIMNSQYAQTQKIMLWILPFIFLISGTTFAIGIMFYWLASNVWTMGQQYIVIRNMPTPGSLAYKQREARLAAILLLLTVCTLTFMAANAYVLGAYGKTLLSIKVFQMFVLSNCMAYWLVLDLITKDAREDDARLG